MAKCEGCDNHFEELDENDLCEDCDIQTLIDRQESYNDLD